ncbi:MAG: hypothetical protein FJ318_09760 [SAR202 cluster bacterium]|nr:hypothetical protein [SAR202 cluster bacterium]
MEPSSAAQVLRAHVHRVMRLNLRTGHDHALRFDYRFLCPSPHEYYSQWFWDSCFHAIAIAHVDPAHAVAELRTTIAMQEPDGFIGHMNFWGASWFSPRNVLAYLQGPVGKRLRHTLLIQPPMLAQAVESVAHTTRDPRLVARFLPALDRYHAWLEENRTPDRDGLLVIVSPYESGMDQSPTYDVPVGLTGRAGYWRLGYRDRLLDLHNYRAEYNLKSLFAKKRFYVKDSLVNALYADSLATMARLHNAAGKPDVANLYDTKAGHVAASVLEKMWDRSRAAFFTLYGANERRTQPLTVGGLVPLIMPTLPRDVAQLIVERQLLDPKTFGLRYPVPSVAASEPTFNPRSAGTIWRGPTWVNTNWLVWRGLRRHGFREQAKNLAERTINMVSQNGLWEYYHPVTGQGEGAKDFGWSALALDMLLNE